MNHKKWLIGTLSLISIPLIALSSFNYFIDPLWTFKQTNKFNQVQRGFDERQQKTNYVTFSKFDYDTLVLGSSRTTYINQTDFKGKKAYNYAVSSMKPEEYSPYIKYAKEKKGSSFDTIIIGLDFASTNENLITNFEQPDHYINAANSRLYRWKNLISLDVYERAKTNLEMYLDNVDSISTYNRNNVKSIEIVTRTQKMDNIKTQLLTYKESAYSNYKYKDMESILKKLKSENPETEFILFTTPVTTELFTLMASLNLLPQYEKWLKDIINVFGEVYNFMYPNSVTNNTDNYVDAHHFKPNIGTLIAHKVTGYQNKHIPKDFGVLVNKDNIEEHIDFIKTTIQ